jgi:hypothetical protein
MTRMAEARGAVIGDSEGDPVRYHMGQTAARAQQLRKRREESTGTPCFVVSRAEWHADPLRALRRAQGLRESRSRRNAAIDTTNACPYTWQMPERPSPSDDPAHRARRTFSALDWKERARLISEAESRALRYYNRIMPLAQGAAFSPVADIETAAQAQQALLLECYYGLLQATLKGQELFLAPWTATKDPHERDREAAEWRRKAEEENTCLHAVQERGDWRPLKERWRQRLPIDEREPDARGGDRGRMAAAFRAVQDAIRRDPPPYDYARVRRVLALVPDETAPAHAAALDPDPPLL